jgi:hypothetical protein
MKKIAIKKIAIKKTNVLNAVLRAIYELARYDVMTAALGVPGTSRRVAGEPRAVDSPSQPVDASRLADAVTLATCFYWKPVLCLQRSVCLVRVLRARGVAARLVIGYRPVPFLSHAWVEVDGRVVNDSPVYQKRMRILHVA